MSIKEKVLIAFDKMFPKNIICGFCGKELFRDKSIRVCDECLNDLKPMEKSCEICGVEINDLSCVCDFCKTHKRSFKKAIACFPFGEKTKLIIHKFKYDGGEYLAEIISKFMVRSILDNRLDFDAILPVPLSHKRRRERGYNQSELLALEIGKELSKPVLADVLRKTKETEKQANLTFKQRAENLKDSFIVLNKTAVKVKRILLVDDVFTTGATVEEISSLLKRVGVKEVNVITFCHTLLK